MRRCCQPLLVALAAAAVNAACASNPAAPGAVESNSCEDRGGAVVALTDGPTTDEDGTFLLADDRAELAGDMSAVPAPGYSVRSQRLPDGRHLLAWVQTNPSNGTPDYFYRFVCNFDFPAVRAASAFAPAVP